MTSVVLVDTGGTVVEYVTAEEDPQQVGWTQTQARVTLQLHLFISYSLIKLSFDCVALFHPSIPFPCRRESVRWTWSLKES